jgi:hypothetical protein
MDCPCHGRQKPAFICQHLLRGELQRLFQPDDAPTTDVDILPKISEHIARRFHVPQDRADELALNAATAMEAHGISLDDWNGVTRTKEVVVKGWIRDGIVMI